MRTSVPVLLGLSSLAFATSAFATEPVEQWNAKHPGQPVPQASSASSGFASAPAGVGPIHYTGHIRQGETLACRVFSDHSGMLCGGRKDALCSGDTCEFTDPQCFRLDGYPMQCPGQQAQPAVVAVAPTTLAFRTQGPYDRYLRMGAQPYGMWYNVECIPALDLCQWRPIANETSLRLGPVVIDFRFGSHHGYGGYERGYGYHRSYGEGYSGPMYTDAPASNGGGRRH